MGTEANVFINIIGTKKKKATGKMPLQLMNKTKFEPASVETFSIEAPDVEDVHKVEVSSGICPAVRKHRRKCQRRRFSHLQLELGGGSCIAFNLSGQLKVSYSLCIVIRVMQEVN